MRRRFRGLGIMGIMAAVLLCMGNAWAFQAGDAVEIDYGGAWYAGKIKEAKDGQYYISYDGYDSSWDEWVGDDRLRAIGAEQAEPAETGESVAAPAVEESEPEVSAPPAQAVAAPDAGGADDVYLINVEGMVWKNGQYSKALSSPVRLQAKGLAGSPNLSLLLLLGANGDVYEPAGLSGYTPPIQPIEAVAIYVVGMEPYILEGSKGEIWRFYRQGPGKGKVDREPESSRFMHGPCVDLAVKGPAEDRAARKVYILGADSRVYVDGKARDGLSPAVGLNKPQAIAVDGDDVYVLDGSNGKVYKNGKHAPELSPTVFVPCVDLAVRKGKSYILTPNGGVLINGQKDPSVSSPVNSEFVGLYVGRVKSK